MVPAAALSLTGSAAAAVAAAPVVAVLLGVLAVTLLAVVLGDRRSASRYADTARPARLLSRRAAGARPAAVAVPAPRTEVAPVPAHLQVPAA